MALLNTEGTPDGVAEKRLGLLVAALRKHRGLSAKKLAELCGTEPQNITRIEKGKNASNTRTLRILGERGLNCTSGWLATGSDTETGFNQALADIVADKVPTWPKNTVAPVTSETTLETVAG